MLLMLKCITKLCMNRTGMAEILFNKLVYNFRCSLVLKFYFDKTETECCYNGAVLHTELLEPLTLSAIM